jgi:hypothetical protein
MFVISSQVREKIKFYQLGHATWRVKPMLHYFMLYFSVLLIYQPEIFIMCAAYQSHYLAANPHF